MRCDPSVVSVPCGPDREPSPASSSGLSPPVATFWFAWAAFRPETRIIPDEE